MSSSSRSPEPGRPDPAPTAPLPHVGWREWVGLPSLGIPRIKAKVDTGARSSSLHATDLEEFEKGGKPWIRFTVLPVQKSDQGMVRVQAPVADRRAVRPSTGRLEVRPVVEVEVQVGDVRFPCEVTLARRDQMGFRMLLGRTALRRRFLVDPGRSYLQPPSSPGDTPGDPADVPPPTEVSE
ncbi:MAG: ATP-dependent zinc protease [Gemmatimonadales bacterium]|nr:MAG: ATP-dependent zinc protease [Gemmatimonadales bacterium]